jgi:hypothetical protein
MVLAQLYGQFGPDPASPIAAAQTALAAYLALALSAEIVDRLRRRTSRARPNSAGAQRLARGAIRA